MARCFSAKQTVRWYVLEPGDGTSYRFGVMPISHLVGRDIITGCPQDRYVMVIPGNTVFKAPFVYFRDMPPGPDVHSKYQSTSNTWTIRFFELLWPYLMQDLTNDELLREAIRIVNDNYCNHT